MEARLHKILKVPGLVQGVVATARQAFMICFNAQKLAKSLVMIGNDPMGELQHLYQMVAGSEN